MHSITVSSKQREEMIDISAEAVKFVRENSTGEGILTLFVQHTTCGMTINENADPDVKSDMLGFLQRLIPQYEPDFQHYEHNSDAHIKAVLTGNDVTLSVRDGELVLGTWQGIYFADYDGPRERHATVTVIGD